MKIVFWVKFHTRKDKQTVQHSKGKKKYTDKTSLLRLVKCTDITHIPDMKPVIIFFFIDLDLFLFVL